MKTITKLTIKELSKKLASKELSAREVTKAYLDAIKEKDPIIKAYLTVTHELALIQAEEIDTLRMKNASLGALAGIPAGIKDNILTKNIRTTCASKMLENFIPPYDATVMERLIKEKTVLLGKLNLDEFAMGSTTENSYYQITANPVNTAYVPGGSSGGSAASVAANEAPFALGTDTGGSIRQPASFCGVVGLKPTYGTVSRYGLVAFASSLDQIGPITKTVEDCAMITEAIMGKDEKDSTSIAHPDPNFLKNLSKGVKGKKAALPLEYFKEGISQEVKEAVLSAAKHYESMGVEIQEVSMSMVDYALPAYYILSGAEASSNLSRFDGVKYGYRTSSYLDLNSLYKTTRSEAFGSEVKRRIMLGSFALSSGYYDAYYKKALQARTLILEEFNRIFETCDFMISPVAPTTAYKIGEKTFHPLEMYLGDIYTVPVNIAGLPAISLPCGKDSKGLPIGMQLIGKAFSEGTLFQAAYAYEQNAKWGE